MSAIDPTAEQSVEIFKCMMTLAERMYSKDKRSDAEVESLQDELKKGLVKVTKEVSTLYGSRGIPRVNGRRPNEDLKKVDAVAHRLVKLLIYRIRYLKFPWPKDEPADRDFEADLVNVKDNFRGAPESDVNIRNLFDKQVDLRKNNDPKNRGLYLIQLLNTTGDKSLLLKMNNKKKLITAEEMLFYALELGVTSAICFEAMKRNKAKTAKTKIARIMTRFAELEKKPQGLPQ